MVNLYSQRLVEDQFRILELHPGSGKDPLKASLKTENLHNAPEFDAISYVWGDGSRQQHIDCDGTDGTITESLYGALMQVRHPQIARRVWADAVCINQQDTGERSHQVARMQHIFGQASTVVVWLGRDCGENLRLALAAIDLIYKACIDYADSQGVKVADLSFSHLESIEIVKDSPLEASLDYDTWLSVSRFFARSWFKRLWCVQEIILSRQCIFLVDMYTLPWEHVGVAAAFLTAHCSRPFQNGLALRYGDSSCQWVFAAQLYWHRGKGNILSNLQLFGSRDATDARDLVYGLLGLQDLKSTSIILEPDYSKNTAEVYIDVVRATINAESGFRVLSNVQHEESFHQAHGLPSWAPYWPRGRYVSYLDRGTWHAGGTQTLEVVFPSLCELLAQGITFDEVVSVSDIHTLSMDEYGSLHPLPDLMLQLWFEFAPSDSENQSSHSHFEKLCRSLTAGYTENGEAVHQLAAEQSLTFYADYLAFIDRLLQSSGQKTRSFTPSHLAAIEGDWERFARAVRYACKFRRIFRTGKGHVGLGPACTDIGDQVCVLVGGTVPYMARPVEEGYNFLGECYIDEIMRGELFEKEALQHWEPKMLRFK